MIRALSCFVTLLVMALAPGTLAAQVCEGIPGPLGSLAFGVGYNSLNGHSGTDVSARVHIEEGSLTASWISQDVFPEVHSGELETPSGEAYSVTSRPTSGRLGVNLALHHADVPWACLRVGGERTNWEREIQLLEPVPLPDSDEEGIPGPDWEFGRVTTIPVGVSIGQSFPLTEGVSLVPFATARYVTFREEFGVNTETRHDWDGTFGVSAGLRHLVVTGTVSRYFRHSDAFSHIRFGVAYPLGGVR